MKHPAKSLVGGLILAVALSTGALAASMTDGVVQKVDQPAGKVTLKHGPIPELDMGEMSMVYRVKDPAMLKGIKVGDKVKFEAAEVDGKYTANAIVKAK